MISKEKGFKLSFIFQAAQFDQKENAIFFSLLITFRMMKLKWRMYSRASVRRCGLALFNSFEKFWSSFKSISGHFVEILKLKAVKMILRCTIWVTKIYQIFWLFRSFYLLHFHFELQFLCCKLQTIKFIFLLRF